MYDPAMVQPMRDELTQGGVVELKTSQEVKDALNKAEGSSVVLVNSVCGCAAGAARPGYLASLDGEVKPQGVYTVFAGVDREAVDEARAFFAPFPPSSPSIAVIRDGKVVHMIERSGIEGNDSGNISKVLKSAYSKYCGPEVDESVEIFDPESSMDLDVEEVQKALESGEALLFDIRPEEEAAMARIEGVEILDQDKATKIIQEEAKDRLLIFHCHHGIRSRQAVKYFQQYGFSNVKSMKGGIQAWSDKVDASVPTY
jgi:putative YphP/YqiW family bacilliredoxin